MVVTQQNTLYPRTVQIGLQTAATIEIRSGLNEGDLVVIGSRAGLKTGQRIQPKVIGAETGN
jgi:hypothetical protein